MPMTAVIYPSQGSEAQQRLHDQGLGQEGLGLCIYIYIYIYTYVYIYRRTGTRGLATSGSPRSGYDINI